MEHYHLTPIQQAKILFDKVKSLETEINIIKTQTYEAVQKLNTFAPDYGGIAINSLTDFCADVLSASQTAARLNTLITLAAIEKNQL